jgi:uncharacterized protein (TIGR02452 family)
MSRKNLVKIAQETLEVIESKKYTNSFGRTLSLDKLIAPAVRMSELYRPDDIIYLPSGKINNNPNVYITKESTLEAAARLSNQDICILNFASAKHPGGGFMSGAMAQEESIARSSALYATLIVHEEFYDANIKSIKDNVGIYTNHAIYSPNVPVFRDDEGYWLDEPYTISVVTSPAPNLTAILDWENPVDDYTDYEIYNKVESVFDTRMYQVLSIMAHHEHRNIILGAWGCGIFGNNPDIVARLFKRNLDKIRLFDNIIFAIYGNTQNVLSFEKVFKGGWRGYKRFNYDI